jgi:hypothetical protein
MTTSGAMSAPRKEMAMVLRLGTLLVCGVVLLSSGAAAQAGRPYTNIRVTSRKVAAFLLKPQVFASVR